ncbi:MAG: response regulator transcription factor [Pseudomonadota bacterium]
MLKIIESRDMIQNGTGRGSLQLKMHIVGPNMLQNELLMSFLEKEMEAECVLYPQLEGCFKLNGEPGHRHIVMIDCQDRKDLDPWCEFDLQSSIDVKRVYLILYNAHPESEIEKKALSRGVRGVFYHKESFRIFPKGIKAILDGELWYSRQTLSQCLITVQNTPQVVYNKADCLTDREKDILLRIAGGTGNQEIAAMLYISMSTVKTHIYNIYKKIDVKNRLQASLWAAKYLKPEPTQEKSLSLF